MDIEDIALKPIAYRSGLTDKLFAMEVGQSVFAETTYQAAYNTVRQAKRRKKSPLAGEFRIVEENDGVRVGRVA